MGVCSKRREENERSPKLTETNFAVGLLTPIIMQFISLIESRLSCRRAPVQEGALENTSRCSPFPGTDSPLRCLAESGKASDVKQTCAGTPATGALAAGRRVPGPRHPRPETALPQPRCEDGAWPRLCARPREGRAPKPQRVGRCPARRHEPKTTCGGGEGAFAGLGSPQRPVSRRSRLQGRTSIQPRPHAEQGPSPAQPAAARGARTSLQTALRWGPGHLANSPLARSRVEGAPGSPGKVKAPVPPGHTQMEKGCVKEKTPSHDCPRQLARG